MVASLGSFARSVLITKPGWQIAELFRGESHARRGCDGAILHCSGGREGLPHGELGWGMTGEWEPLTAVAGFLQPFQLRVSQCFMKEISIIAHFSRQIELSRRL